MKKFIFSCLLILLSAIPIVAAEYSLEDLYKLALERSEKIKITEEDLYVAERVKDKAMSVLMPKLSAVGGYTKYNSSLLGDTGTYVQPDEGAMWGVRLDQSVTLNGREVTAFRITKDGIEKSKYDLFAVKEGYMLNVATAYYGFLKAKKALDIAKSNVERLTKHRQAAATRLKVGEVTKTALLRAEAELSGAQSELIRTMNSVQLAKAVLARVVGIEGDFDVKENEKFSNIIEYCQPLTVGCLKDKANAERAEIKSVNIQKRIAEDQVRYARGAYWPTLSVEGVYTKRQETPETGSLVRESVYGGLRLNFPFFEGGLRNAEVKEALAKKRQAELAIGDLKKTIDVDVENAYLDYVTQSGVLKSLEDQFAFAKDNYHAISRQFEFGLANSIDVMDANTLLVTAERQLIDAVYNYQQSILKVKRAAGTLLKSVISSESGVRSAL
jgi:outer membrane protein